MASEFASHIGMKGKFMCRICKVCGTAETKTDAGEKARLTAFMTVRYV